jgi:PTH1 family peptidyl-tRNA hydrolase
MNLSGIPLLEFLEDHPVPAGNILVLVDDVNLAAGEVRLRKSGSDGGHNGIKSIIYNLQDDSFPRLRFGIGSDFEKGEMADFVLSRFGKDESEIIEKGTGFAVELIEKFVAGGYKEMLDYYSISRKKMTLKNDDSAPERGKMESLDGK